jgi:hypothetical protein
MHALGAPIGPVRIFMSFDLAHDGDLRDRLVEESLRSGSGFEISGCSESGALTDTWNDRARRLIGAADEVIVICGEHTQDSTQVGAEIGIAQQEQKPYFLLWGRREVMCTKPVGARAGDSMYSWTSSIIRDQVVMTLRVAQPREVPEHYKRP